MKKTIVLIAFIMSVLQVTAADPTDRIMYNGQPLFLNGTNLAWIDFARDIGPGETNFDAFGEVFREIHDYGANSVRLWLHTNSWATPEFTADTVSGPGEGAISDLIQILDSAYKYDIGVLLSLWSHDMLRLNIGEPYLTQNRAILEDTAVLNSYIQNALIPMVDSTKDHPGIIAWEIFNEPEGLIEGVPDGGWGSHGHVTREQISRAVNRMAGAIHSVDTALLVTNGTHTIGSNSDRGEGNFYTDSALIAMGGDSLGYLDFYQVHYYSFDLNPFSHPYSYWNLDKPLIIGEFFPDCDSCGDFSNYENLLNNGYAGAMGWMWLSAEGELIKQEAQHTFLNYTAEVDIDNMLGDTPYLLFSGPDYGQVFDSGSDIAFEVDAQDTDGTVAKVEYFMVREFIGDSLLTTLSAEPWDFTWTAPDDGQYSVYVIATDNDNYTKTSQPIAFTVGDPPVYKYEAENAELTGGATAESDATASAGGYVNFTSNASILWNVMGCPADGTYDMTIGFGVPYGEKNNYFIINGDEANQLDIHFEGPADDWLRDTIQVDLVEGTNTIEVVDFWGWMYFDYIEFSFPRPPLVQDISITTATGEFLIDEPNGTLQMIGTVTPEEAVQDVRWTLNNPGIASIGEYSGLLTAERDGVVRVFAWAMDGSGVVSNADVTLSNQPDVLNGTSLTSLEIYPNPANQELHLRADVNLDQAEICNMQGQVISRDDLNSSVGIINISELEAGMYYLRLQTFDGEFVTRMFVKK